MAKDKINRIQARAIPYVAPRRPLHPNGTLNGRPVRQAADPCSLIKTPLTYSYCTEYLPDCTSRVFLYNPATGDKSCKRIACVTGRDIRTTDRTHGVFSDTRCAVSTTLSPWTKHINEDSFTFNQSTYGNIPGARPAQHFVIAGRWRTESQLWLDDAVVLEVNPAACIQGETNRAIAEQIQLGHNNAVCSSTPSMAASAASVLATTAAFLMPVPTSVIAASSPTVEVSGTAVAVGLFASAVVVVGAASYASYKLAQYCYPENKVTPGTENV